MNTPVSLPGVPDPVQVDVLNLAGVAVPVVELRRRDERTSCRLAHRYLAGLLDGSPADFAGCPFYHGRHCDMNGKGANPCLFHEDEGGRSWARVREWRLLEWSDGSTAITLAHSAAEIAVDLGARVIGAAEVTTA